MKAFNHRGEEKENVKILSDISVLVAIEGTNITKRNNKKVIRDYVVNKNAEYNFNENDCG